MFHELNCFIQLKLVSSILNWLNYKIASKWIHLLCFSALNMISDYITVPLHNVPAQTNSLTSELCVVAVFREVDTVSLNQFLIRLWWTRQIPLYIWFWNARLCTPDRPVYSSMEKPFHVSNQNHTPERIQPDNLKQSWRRLNTLCGLQY